ncbi:hypothetical protein SAMD00019534_022430, partial [Acytostelium subglobosum LB1]|uniref:hypothetical protein n=1 Tax=Acytostelium subglobosum LB1 TaxID=1410327 RepID=UPI0006451D20
TLLSMSAPQHLLSALGMNDHAPSNKKPILSLIIGDGNDDDDDDDDDELPSTLQSLTYGKWFNNDIYPGYLPESLTLLRFGKMYNRPLVVGMLPDALKTLAFGSHFNQMIEVGVLPQSLKRLTFGKRFNQTLAAGMLPGSLEYLGFEGEYDQPFESDTLPQSLQTLRFSEMYNLPLNIANLPASMTTLDTVDILDPASLPPSITTLSLRSVPTPQCNFPNPRLTTLLFRERYRFGGHHDMVINDPVPDRLPDSITCLHLNSKFSQPLVAGYLPNSILHLSNFYNGDHPLLIGALPSRLRSLWFSPDFNLPIESGVLPINLTSLQFGLNFNQRLVPGILPPSLEILDLGYSYDQELTAGALPPSLTHLTLSKDLKDTDVVLPNSIKHLDMITNRNINIINALASSIEEVTVIYYHVRDLEQDHEMSGVCGVALSVFNATLMGDFNLCSPGITPAMHSFQTFSRLFPNVQTYNFIINRDQEPGIFKRIDDTTILHLSPKGRVYFMSIK